MGYASPPPSSDVHFCRVLGTEDMWARDSIYAATKQALNLNVGEPRTVRMIYFLPNDRPFQQAVVDSMKVTIRQIQTFYAEQMQAHGYGNKTFRFETDAQGEPMVHRVDGQHPTNHYRLHYGPVETEVEQKFDLSANIYLFVIDNGTQVVGYSGQLVLGVRFTSSGGKNVNYALVSDRFHWTVVAHELGHTFGLGHDFRDDAYIMSYGDSYGRGRSLLSACSAEFLAVHPYFNPDTSTEEEQSPVIELLSPTGYPVGTTKVSVQLKISDSSGLHQVILFVRTLSSRYGPGSEVKTCRGLAGEKETVFEFEYDGVIPSGGVRSFSDFTEHSILVEVVDTEGNVGGAYIDLWEVPPHYIATLDGHTENVTSIAFSPDGTLLASGSEDRTVVLWDVATRTNIANLEGHRVLDQSMSFSPDGTLLASGGSHAVLLWDVSTGENIATHGGHRGVITSVSFSPDGTLLASGSSDTTVVLWDVLTRTSIATLEGHRAWVQSVSFSPDGKTLASSSDTTVVLWDVATRTKTATLEHTGYVSSIAFSPDGMILASARGGGRQAIELWDVATGHNIATLEIVYAGGVRSVMFSPDGMILASAGGEITLWDVSEWAQPLPVTLEKISGDNQQGTPGAELANPLIVEVRDQYGSVFEGAEVTFTVTAGEGRLSGRFTTENAITDANGRAQSTLSLGPGTNTVEVSVAGFEPVIFNTMGVGTPATPVMEGAYQTWHLPDGAISRLGKGSISEYDRAVAFSPDGQRLAVAGGIGIWLYDVATSRELALLAGHTRNVHAVSFSPDGRTLASGSRDGTIRLWNVVTGETIATLEGYTSWVRSVAYSPGGTMLASGSVDGTVRLWDVSTGETIATLEGHTEPVFSVAYSPGGTMLASGSRDNTVRLWDVLTRTHIATLEGHTGSVRSVSFSPDGTLLASGSVDNTVLLWDVNTEISTATLRHETWVQSASFSPDGTTLASASLANIKLWDVESKIDIATLEGHTSGVGSVSFSPDGTTLASASTTDVKLWDVATQSLTTLRHTRPIKSVAFSPNGTMLAVGSNLWDVSTRRQVTTLERLVGFVTFSPDGKTLASGTGRRVRLWDVSTGEITAVFVGHRSGVTSMAYSPNGEILASGSDDTTIKLWDVSTEEIITTFEGHRSQVTSVAFSPDGAMLASSGAYPDNTIRLWDIATREIIATLEEHTNTITSVAYSPDGTMLVSGDWNSTVRLWDVSIGEHIATLERRHREFIASVAFSPDGTTLASGAGDATVRLWDVATKENIATFEGHTGSVHSVAYSPDGTTLASGSYDGSVLLWDMSGYVTPVGTGVPVASSTADFDGNGTVGISDFLLFATQFGLSQGDAGYDARFDLDGNGTIGISDFLIFVNAFGE